MPTTAVKLNQSHLIDLARLVRHEIMYLEGRKSDVTVFPKTDHDLLLSMIRWNEALDKKVNEARELLEILEQEIKP